MVHGLFGVTAAFGEPPELEERFGGLAGAHARLEPSARLGRVAGVHLEQADHVLEPLRGNAGLGPGEAARSLFEDPLGRARHRAGVARVGVGEAARDELAEVAERFVVDVPLVRRPLERRGVPARGHREVVRRCGDAREAERKAEVFAMLAKSFGAEPGSDVGAPVRVRERELDLRVGVSIARVVKHAQEVVLRAARVTHRLDVAQRGDEIALCEVDARDVERCAPEDERSDTQIREAHPLRQREPRGVAGEKTEHGVPALDVQACEKSEHVRMRHQPSVLLPHVDQPRVTLDRARDGATRITTPLHERVVLRAIASVGIDHVKREQGGEHARFVAEGRAPFHDVVGERRELARDAPLADVVRSEQRRDPRK